MAEKFTGRRPDSGKAPAAQPKVAAPAISSARHAPPPVPPIRTAPAPPPPVLTGQRARTAAPAATVLLKTAPAPAGGGRQSQHPPPPITWPARAGAIQAKPAVVQKMDFEKTPPGGEKKKPITQYDGKTRKQKRESKDREEHPEIYHIIEQSKKIKSPEFYMGQRDTRGNKKNLEIARKKEEAINNIKEKKNFNIDFLALLQQNNAANDIIESMKDKLTATEEGHIIFTGDRSDCRWASETYESAKINAKVKNFLLAVHTCQTPSLLCSTDYQLDHISSFYQYAEQKCAKHTICTQGIHIDAYIYKFNAQEDRDIDTTPLFAMLTKNQNSIYRAYNHMQNLQWLCSFHNPSKGGKKDPHKLMQPDFLGLCPGESCGFRNTLKD